MTRLLRVLSGETLSPPPVWLMRQAGRYLPEYRALRAKAGGFLDLCLNPQTATEVTMQPIRRFGFDASILFSDILIIPYAMGQRLWFAEGEGPRLIPIMAITELPEIDSDTIHQRLSASYETLNRLRQQLNPDTTLIGFCGAPWTVASYMVAGRGTPDLKPIRDFSEAYPDQLQAIIDRLVEISSAYLLKQVEAGAQVLQIFESWAQVLRGSQFDRWSRDPISKLIEKVKAEAPNIPIIVFPRKADDGYLKIAKLPWVDGLSIDPDIDLEWASDQLQQHCALQGNLDPMDLVAGPERINRAVDYMKSTIGQGPWIANLGHGIVPQTPIEHVEHFIAKIREV